MVEAKKEPLNLGPGELLVKGSLDTKIEPDKVCAQAKLIGLFFSADWPGPCQLFTPELLKAYKEINEDPNFQNKADPNKA